MKKIFFLSLNLLLIGHIFQIDAATTVINKSNNSIVIEFYFRPVHYSRYIGIPSSPSFLLAPGTQYSYIFPDKADTITEDYQISAMYVLTVGAKPVEGQKYWVKSDKKITGKETIIFPDDFVKSH